MFTNTDKHTIKLSLAVLAIDDYTKDRPIGEINISLKEDSKPKAIKNPSGYHLFLDLPNDPYTIQIKSRFYFDEEVEVTLSSLDPIKPVKEVNLKPNPSYPFLPGTTLIRGLYRIQLKNQSLTQL